MEEVLEQFKTVAVQDDSKSNFQDLFKNWGKFSNQEERRKDILEIQKQNRCATYDNCRGVSKLVKAVQENNSFSFRGKYKPGVFIPGFTKSIAPTSDVLMLSEWMVEKPDDFHENWVVVPCPRGTRTLVVASQGITKCYSKYGNYLFENWTALPGGSPYDSKTSTNYCILDCMYEKSTRTMHILDLLAWNITPMTDGEKEFRHYWLEIKIPDLPDLKVINNRNAWKFSMLPQVPCNRESLNKFMMKYPQFENNCPVLDGLLFYHKHAQYLSGVNPLVGWLYPYMVQEILGSDITVNNSYLLEKPADYSTQDEFIERFDAKMERKYKRVKQYKKAEAMVQDEASNSGMTSDDEMATTN